MRRRTDLPHCEVTVRARIGLAETSHWSSNFVWKPIVASVDLSLGFQLMQQLVLCYTTCCLHLIHCCWIPASNESVCGETNKARSVLWSVTSAPLTGKTWGLARSCLWIGGQGARICVVHWCLGRLLHSARAFERCGSSVLAFASVRICLHRVWFVAWIEFFFHPPTLFH